MAYTIAITNNKGGCGKTVTAINTGAALRLRGYDVLLVDFDGQANLTTALRVEASTGTTYDTMKAQITPYIEPVRVLGPEGATCGVLDVLPSCRDLSALEVELATQSDRVTRFRAVIDKYRDKYDYIVIDTPPSLGVLTVNTLYAADAAIVTVEPEFMAVQGLLAIKDTIQTVAEFKGEPLPYCVAFTRYDKRKGLHRMTIEQVEASGLPTFATRIRSNVALGEAPAVGVDIFRYAANSYGATDYNALCSEVMAWRKVRHVNHRYRG